ncbi:hypothetical protein DXG01_013684 [Tephrocybe rancida]|nr:hypothetical protein DXG01_013684 [Tephrocybe rancida]
MESLYKTLLTYRLLDLELSRVCLDHVKLSFKDLNNLSKILQRTQKAISRRGKRLKASPSLALTPPVASPHNPLLNLYAMLVDNVHKSALVHTRINFSLATLHLAYLLKGNVYLPTETSKIEDFIASSSGSSEDQGAIDRLRSDFGSSTLGCSTVMHRTLFLALAVSPVMLLLPRSYDQSAGKSAILESWIQFGSVTLPPWMVAADDALWKVLLAATQGGDVISHVGDAMTTLQPYMSSSTPAWFSLVSNKPSSNPPSTSRIEVIDSDSDCERNQPPLEPSLPFTSSVEPGPSPAPTPAQVPATSLSLHTPAIIASVSLLTSPPSSADLHLVPSVSMTSSQPVQSSPSISSEAPPHNDLGDSDNAEAGGMPATGAQMTMSPVALPHLPLTADLDAIDPSALTLSHHESTSSDSSSDLSDIASSPPASSRATEPSMEQPTARRSSRVPASKMPPSYPASTGNVRKRKKRDPHQIKKDPTPVPLQVPHSPDFINLTLEDSDNEVTDTVLTFKSINDFVLGDVEVTYPVNSPSPVFTWLPKFHLSKDLKWFYSLHDTVKRSANNGRVSPVEVLSQDAFDVATSAHLLSAIKTKACIHVTAKQRTDAGFMEETFSEICNVNETTTLHDFTIKSGARTRKGTIMDLLAVSAMNPPVALSALHIPSAYDMFPKLRFASDWFAWVKVQGKAYCHVTEFYPVPEMRWAIASTGSAHHYWHYDANGLGMFLRVDTGIKLWFIAVPKNGDFRMFMQPDVMTSFELNESNIDLWDVRVNVLFAGDFFALVLWDYANNYHAFEASIKNRTQARSLLYWIFSSHQFILPSGAITGLDALQSIFCTFLAHHAHLLIHYKCLAAAAKVDGIHKSMNLSDVAAAVSDCV